MEIKRTFLCLLLATCLGLGLGCDDGGDSEETESTEFEGTWEQIGCANADTCDDIACIEGWEQWPRKLQFVAGSSTVKGWIGGDPTSDAYTKNGQICTDVGEGNATTEMCFALEACGEYLLYCMVPQLCEKLVRID